MNIISLTPVDLSIAALLVLMIAGLSFLMQLNLSYQIIIAAIRTTLQLFFIGFVLQALFSQTRLDWVSVLAAIMILLAGREVMVRQNRPFLGLWGYGLGVISIFLSSFVITIITLTIIVKPDPFYLPQYAIPLLGMLLGNTMNGISLAIDHLTQNAYDQKGIIEAKLMLGNPWQHAIKDIQKNSVRVGMIPTINAMAAAGIISLPGMMTGQILAGALPLEAVKYQILIMFLIAAGTGLGTITATYLGAKRLFDERERLRLDRISEK